VGGAHLAEMVDFSSGINLWKEWANIEHAKALQIDYVLPEVQNLYTGIVISLARQQWPDLSPFNDPEIVWRMHEEYHLGLIVQSENRVRVMELMDKYAEMIRHDYHASAPAQDKPTH
jgi:hypothetical protein